MLESFHLYLPYLALLQCNTVHWYIISPELTLPRDTAYVRTPLRFHIPYLVIRFHIVLR